MSHDPLHHFDPSRIQMIRFRVKVVMSESGLSLPTVGNHLLKGSMNRVTIGIEKRFWPTVDTVKIGFDTRPKLVPFVFDSCLCRLLTGHEHCSANKNCYGHSHCRHLHCLGSLLKQPPADFRALE